MCLDEQRTGPVGGGMPWFDDRDPTPFGTDGMRDDVVGFGVVPRRVMIGVRGGRISEKLLEGGAKAIRFSRKTPGRSSIAKVSNPG